MSDSSKIYNTSSDYVYLDIKNKIVNRELRQHERLLEVRISDSLGVSRTPVREALKRLADEGLVKITPNSGARVASPTVAEIKNAHCVREGLENLSVEIVCRDGIDSRHSEALERVLREEENAVTENDREAFFTANSNFHHILADACKNTFLTDFIDKIVHHTNVYVLFSKSDEQAIKDSHAEHRAILCAVRNHDSEAAQNIMKKHLSRVYTLLEKQKN
ncbi:MAG: GntR family transcriptional regulator [Synergistes sp.]|nr:GntR family transcriptional regulator [Synergistes sp.]